MRTQFLALALATASLRPAPAAADCIHDAAAYQGVHPDILRAIGWHESRLRPGAFARNRNGSVDIGAFQINSIHLQQLARFGIDGPALQDGCVSAYVAAWHYRQQMNRHGNTWRAVGAYHSQTPARAAWYANAIAAVLMRWGVAPSGPLPYDPALTLAPGRHRPSPRPASPPESAGSTVLDAGGAAALAAPGSVAPSPDSPAP